MDSYRSALQEHATHIICTSVPNSARYRRAWGLVRMLRDHDAVDLAECPLFWECARVVMHKRHWLRAALFLTVVP